MRIPLLIAWGVAIIGIILGSFLDLNISQTIAKPTNNFALLISAIGPTIGFGAVAFMGGGFIALGVKKEYHIALRILFFVLAACCYGVSVYYPAGEYFGINGFNKPDLKWVGYLIVVLPEAAAMVGGYFLLKDYQNKNIWIIYCAIIVCLLIALVGIIPIIKDNMHRPRYRLISRNSAVEFNNWWQACKNYKELKELYHEASDNFKSFPSGHTAEASIPFFMVTFLPLVNSKFSKVQLPLFLGTCGLVIAVALARIFAAAHFLSDVSWGATIMISLVLIANEVIMRIKTLQPKEQSQAE